MPVFQKKPLASLVVLATWSITALSSLPANAQQEHLSLHDKNIVETLEESGNFSTLLAALNVAGLSSTLEEVEAATLFAPSDRAFRSLPKGTLESLLQDPAALLDLLTYHILPGTLKSSDLKDGALATLLKDSPLEINVTRYWQHYVSIDVDAASVRRKDLSASNGVIHEIDAVLDPGFKPSPPLIELIGAPQFSSFAALLTQAHLDFLLEINYREITVLAPTNDAFEKIAETDLAALINDRHALRKALLNHIILRPTTSENLLPQHTIGSASITKANALASNGVLHTIDTFLLPEPPSSLASLIATTPDLTTLSTALTTSGFAETLNSTRRAHNFTIFAPSDAAFAQLPPTKLSTLLEAPTPGLADALGLHIIRGKITAARLRDGQKLKTLSGNNLSIKISDTGTITINGTTISQTDLPAANGVVHIIDAVLQTEPFTLADLITSKSYLSTLAATLDAAGLTPTIDDPAEKFTLLAPLNSAFRQLPQGALEALLEDPTGALAQALQHHIIPGSHSIDSLTDASATTTLAGTHVTLGTRIFQWYWFPLRRITVNGIALVVTDLPADNGTLHVITEVLLQAPKAPK